MVARKNEIRQDWEDVDVMMPDGDTVTQRLPRQRTPVLARPGMVAEVLIDCDCVYGTIQEITPDFAIVVCEDGETVAVRWNAVLLGAVQPDPAELPRQAGVNVANRRRLAVAR